MSLVWRVELFGGLRAVRGDRSIARFAMRRVASLLAFLAYHAGREQPREQLIEMLWPESDLDSGRKRFSVVLSSLRGELEPPDVPPGSVLIADRFNVRLSAAAVATDVADF